MTSETAQAMIEELDQLLDRERHALLAGDLDQIARILSLKETLIDRINTLEALERDDLSGVQMKLSRNQTLLNGAMDGIRAVADRMADLRRVRQGLDTYDGHGRKTRHSTRTQGSIERRA